MMNKVLHFVLVIAAFFVYGVSQGQETTSEIQGIVKDGGKGIADATVTAIHLPTGSKYVTTSRKDGRYNIPNARVGGPYSITVNYVGYKSETQENIFLTLGEDYKADFALQTEASNLGEVTVKTYKQDKIFNNGHTGSQEIITRTQIERIPTISRSISDFTRLEPTSNGLSFGGRSSQYNNITVDGANFNNSFGLSSTLGGQTNSQPIALDAIEQIQVNVSPYDVRQGGFSGAGINTITKSGTNTFKGSAYTYLRNENFQGYNVENTAIAKTPITYNIEGVSLGGPIVKNKLFFFGSVEFVRQSVPATSIVPSDATHTPGGNVSNANADTLTALSNFLKSTYGYDPGAFTGYNFKTNSDKITAKIDWNIDDKNTLTFKYNYLKSSADQFASTSRPGSGQATGGQPGINSLPFYGSGYVINNNFNIFIAELNTRFNNKSTNKFQIGYTALRDFRTPHSSSSTFPLVDILSGGNIYTTFGYEPYTYNNILNTDVYQLSDAFTYYLSSHEITVGTQNNIRRYTNDFAPDYNGGYQFNSLQDFYNNKPAANYYLQYSALPGGTFPEAKAGSTELGFFAQDKYRVTNNFTLTYGFRLDYTIYKQSFQDNPYFDALTFNNGSQYNIGKAPSNNVLISPRIGANWDVFGDKSLQVRGGLGIFAGPPPFVWISNQASNNGIQFGSFTKNGAPYVFSPDPTKYIPAAGLPNSSYSTAITASDFKYPSVLKVSGAIDKKFDNGIILTYEFTGSKDINAVYYSNLNLNESNAFALNSPDNRLRYLTSVANSNKYYYGTTLANPNLGTAILMSNSSKGYAYTHTVRVQKTLKELYLSAAYTYSEAKNVAEGGSTASSLWSGRGVYQDPNTPTLAYASYYQPHRVIAFASYKFEYNKDINTSFGLIFEAAPAGTTTYTYNGDLNGDGNRGNDLIYIPNVQSDINLVAVGSVSKTNPNGVTNGSFATDQRTSSQMWAQLNNFIGQDHYLAFHRGQYAAANAIVLPFYNKFDLNITQDFYVRTGKGKKDRHNLKVTTDILNLGNLLNRNWGILKTPTNSQFLNFEGMAADGKTPLFSFNYLDKTNRVPIVNSFTNNTGITSRWQIQLGIRYQFN